MSLSAFIKKIHAAEKVTFDETLSVISANYHYQPTDFYNGLGSDKILNAAGSNEGSCRIFAFTQLQQLTQTQTLGLFGDYYWQDVLNNPDGNGHQNIRLFMQYGWEGIHFQGVALTPK